MNKANKIFEACLLFIIYQFVCHWYTHSCSNTNCL